MRNRSTLAANVALACRRLVAWWIDSLLFAGPVTLAVWALGAWAPQFLAGPRDVVPTVLFAVVFFAYRVLAETFAGTTVGKWALRLVIAPERDPQPAPALTAALRNSWVWLSLLGLASPGLAATVPPLIVGLFGLCALLFGATPTDALSRSRVLVRPGYRGN